jgi:hypothetical protein
VRGADGRQPLLPLLPRVGRQPPLDRPYDAGATPAFSRTRRESSLLTGSMIRASTSCRNTSSPPAASSSPSTR